MQAYLWISSAVFGLIALLHILRLLLQWPAQVADWTVPIWVSWIAFGAAAALSIWAFRLVRQARRSSVTTDIEPDLPKVAASGLLGLEAVYQAATHHWAHAEQIRWTLLYNYLMASTILLLAWATVFAGNHTSVPATAVLVLLSLAGASVSAIWILLGRRASAFVEKYALGGRALENCLKPDLSSAAANPSSYVGPFTSAHELRKDFEKGTKKGDWARVTQTHRVVAAVPIIFLVLYLVLLVISLTW